MISPSMDIDMFSRYIGTLRAGDALDALHYEINALRLACMDAHTVPVPPPHSREERYLVQLRAIRQYMESALWVEHGQSMEGRPEPWSLVEQVVKTHMERRGRFEGGLSGLDVSRVYALVDRTKIEACDISETLGLLNSLLVSVETVEAFRGQVWFWAIGYEDEERPMFEFPEFRKYFQALDQQFPYWFHFLVKEAPQLDLVLMTLCDYERASDRLRILQPKSRALFFRRHWAAVDYLYGCYGLDPSEKKKLHKEVEDCLAEGSASDEEMAAWDAQRMSRATH